MRPLAPSALVAVIDHIGDDRGLVGHFGHRAASGADPGVPETMGGDVHRHALRGERSRVVSAQGVRVGQSLGDPRLAGGAAHQVAESGSRGLRRRHSARAYEERLVVGERASASERWTDSQASRAAFSLGRDRHLALHAAIAVDVEAVVACIRAGPADGPGAQRARSAFLRPQSPSRRGTA